MRIKMEEIKKSNEKVSRKRVKSKENNSTKPANQNTGKTKNRKNMVLHL